MSLGDPPTMGLRARAFLVNMHDTRLFEINVAKPIHIILYFVTLFFYLCRRSEYHLK